MTFRVEFSYQCTVPNCWEHGRIHKDIEADSASEAVEKLLSFETRYHKPVKDCYKVWSVDIWQKIDRPKNGWVEADNPYSTDF